MGGVNIAVKSVTPEEFEKLSRGSQFEINVLGHGWQYAGAPEYQDWSASIFEILTRELPGYNPLFPKGGLTQELFDGVRRFLPRKYRRFLRLYVSLASSLDYWHGVDAFFCMEGSYVTLDVTTDAWKVRKADFLVTPEDVVDGSTGTSTNFSIDLLKRIARMLRDRHRRRNLDESTLGRGTYR